MIVKNVALWASIAFLASLIVDWLIPAFPRDTRLFFNAVFAIVFALIACLQIINIVRANRAAKEK